MAAGPTPDLDSRVYWDAVADHVVLVASCSSCERRWLPFMPGCPYCGALDPASETVPGTGSIYSYVTVQVAVGGVDEADVPYTVVTVDLDGGGRMFAKLDGAGSNVAVGLRVSPSFVDHEGWTELRFCVERAA